MKEFLGVVTLDDFKSDDWFIELLTFALGRYSKGVDAGYFRRKYPDLPRDAVVLHVSSWLRATQASGEA